MRPFEHFLQRRQLRRAEGGAVPSRFPWMPCGQIVGVINVAATTRGTAASDAACNGRQLWKH